MTTEDQNQNNETQDNQPSELETLKARADQMGISYHPNIGVEKLREKVNQALDADQSEETDSTDEANQDGGDTASDQTETPNQRRARMKREAEALVRVRITCMNPNKREWDGELFTVSNAVVGTMRKMVPFDVEWHVPRMILNMIKQRQCQVFVTKKDGRGHKTRQGKLIKEYAVEELEPLSEAELKKLAQRQAMANGTAEIA